MAWEVAAEALTVDLFVVVFRAVTEVLRMNSSRLRTWICGFLLWRAVMIGEGVA